jgi:hypothetical protein
MFTIFISTLVFFILIVTPQWKKTVFLEITGFILLSTSFLDLTHSFFYPGFTGISNVQYSVMYWMLARGLQSFGLLYASFRKEAYLKKGILKNLVIIIPSVTLLLTFSPKFLPANLFYNPSSV